MRNSHVIKEVGLPLGYADIYDYGTIRLHITLTGNSRELAKLPELYDDINNLYLKAQGAHEARAYAEDVAYDCLMGITEEKLRKEREARDAERAMFDAEKEEMLRSIFLDNVKDGEEVV